MQERREQIDDIITEVKNEPELDVGKMMPDASPHEWKPEDLRRLHCRSARQTTLALSVRFSPPLV